MECFGDTQSRTDTWSRNSDAVQSVGSRFKQSMETTLQKLPDGTVEVVSRFEPENCNTHLSKRDHRDSEHSNEKDPRDHFTAVALNGEGIKITTFHLQVKTAAKRNSTLEFYKFVSIVPLMIENGRDHEWNIFSLPCIFLRSHLGILDFDNLYHLSHHHGHCLLIEGFIVN